MSSFLGFCFYENLQELNGVRMRTNGEKDEFLFLGSYREKGLSLSFLRESWVAGEWVG